MRLHLWRYKFVRVVANTFFAHGVDSIDWRDIQDLIDAVRIIVNDDMRLSYVGYLSAIQQHSPVRQNDTDVDQPVGLLEVDGLRHVVSDLLTGVSKGVLEKILL